MCIVHSTLWDATTPYTERWQTVKATQSERRKWELKNI